VRVYVVRVCIFACELYAIYAIYASTVHTLLVSILSNPYTPVVLWRAPKHKLYKYRCVVTYVRLPQGRLVGNVESFYAIADT
jgi:hypothetical protein